MNIKYFLKKIFYKIINRKLYWDEPIDLSPYLIKDVKILKDLDNRSNIFDFYQDITDNVLKIKMKFIMNSMYGRFVERQSHIYSCICSFDYSSIEHSIEDFKIYGIESIYLFTKFDDINILIFPNGSIQIYEDYKKKDYREITFPSILQLEYQNSFKNDNFKKIEGTDLLF